MHAAHLDTSKEIFWQEPQTGLTSYAYFLKEVGGDEQTLLDPSPQSARWKTILQDAKSMGATFVVAVIPTCALTDDPHNIAEYCKRFAQQSAHEGLQCVFSLQALEDALPPGKAQQPQTLWSKKGAAESPILEALASICATAPNVVGVVLHEEPCYASVQDYQATCATLIERFRQQDPSTPLFVRDHTEDDQPSATIGLTQTHQAVFPTVSIFGYPYLLRKDVGDRVSETIKSLPCLQSGKRPLIVVGHNEELHGRFNARHAFFTAAIEATIAQSGSVTVFGHYGTRSTKLCFGPGPDTDCVTDAFKKKPCATTTSA